MMLPMMRPLPLLVSMWLLGLGGGMPSVQGAPYYRSYHMHRHRHQRRRDDNYDYGRGPPRPTGGYGFSPNFGMYEEETPSSSSYFERHGISPPPLISRARRTRRVQGLAIDTEEAPPAAGTGDAGDTTGDPLFGADEPQTPGREVDGGTPSELELIIADDANARLRHDLIIWGQYDKHSYPWEYVWYNQTGKRTGVPVEMNINFHRVFSADIVNSVMDLVVWMQLLWVDPRLTWKPEEYGNLNHTWFWLGDGGSGGETSEIWTPDIELWNLRSGLKESLEDTYARVSYDGTVYWSRPGHLRPACKFEGLDTFPFDRLTCAMEFGSWMFSGKYIMVKKMEGTVKNGEAGYSLGGSQTAGESYEEYSFAEKDPITCNRHMYTYQSAPEDDWPVLMYHVTLERSWQPYARGYVTTQIVLNLVGFSAFWLPPSCGERMSLSITAMLAALAAEIVVAAYLPACAEMTWFSKFSILSMAFAFVSLIESVAVLYFYYRRRKDMVPRWYSFAKDWYLVRQAKRRGEDVKKFGKEMATRTTILATDATNLMTERTNTAIESIATGVKEMQKRISQEDGNDDADAFFDAVDNDERKGDESSGQHAALGGNEQQSPPSVRFLDASEKGYSQNSMGESGNRRGSVAYPASAPIPKNADDFLDEEELENNLRWKRVATRIDDVSRFWIPLAYVISLSIILAEVF